MILGAMGHELGSLAAAISMRADSLMTVDLSKEQAALKAIGAELRQMSAAQRALRSAETPGRLSPLGPDTVSRWWGLFSRIIRATTPRRLGLNPEFSEGELESGQDYALTLMVIALIQDIAERCPPDTNPEIALSVAGAARGGETVVVVEVALPPEAPKFRARRTRWLRYAEYACQERGGSLSSILDAQHTRHSLSLPTESQV